MLNHTGSASVAQVVEVHVGNGADVSVVSLQDWADDAVHLTHHEASIGRDAAGREHRSFGRADHGGGLGHARGGRGRRLPAV